MRRLLIAAVVVALSSSFASGGFLGELKKAGKTIEKAGKDAQRFEKKTRGVRKAAKAAHEARKGLSASEEYYVGRAVAAQILSRYKPHPDPMVQGYVQAVGQVAAMASERPEIYGGYHFLVIESDEVNAMAAPGGFVFVARGLLERLETEDELACILAHEIGHIVGRHGVVSIEKDRRKKANLKFFGEVGKAFDVKELKKATKFFDSHVGKIVDKLVVSGYSKKQEFEADRSGALTASDAGYDPQGLDDFLSGLGTGRRGWFKTHPSPKMRLKKLEEAGIGPISWHRPASVRAKRFKRVMSRL